jgi:hypothetical protein
MLDVFGSLGSVKDSVIGFLGSSFKSPIWTAVIVTFIIMLILLFWYPVKSNCGTGKHIKIIIYIFLTTTISLYIHDATIKQIWQSELQDKDVQKTLDGIKRYQENPGLYKSMDGVDQIKPNVISTDASQYQSLVTGTQQINPIQPSLRI